MKKSAKLPTFLGLIILTFGLVTGVVLINSRQIFKLGAQAEAAPKNIRIGNITNNSVTISWTTDLPSKGFIKWNTTNKNLSKVANGESQEESEVHLITINNLNNQSDLFFTINSNGRDYANSNIPWQTQTLPSEVISQNSLTATGVILSSDGITPIKSIVNVIVNGQTLSTLTSPEGSWVLPISKYVSIVDENSLIEIIGNSGSRGLSQATIFSKSIKNTPIMLIGKTYDFRNINPSDESQPKSSLELPEKVEQSSRFEVDKLPQEAQDILVTLESIEDGEIITTQDPELFGEGPKNTTIEISVESELQSAIVEVDKNGNWKWNPPNNLEIGEHKVTIKWTDKSGIVRTITRNFVVSAAEGPAYVATPSATLKATSTPTTTPTSLPTATATASSTGTPQPVPETGYLTNTLVLFIIGIVLVFTGIYVNQKSYI